MWLLSNIGFFSVVQKPGDKSAGLLTIRSRVRADLESLRKKYLPDMSKITVNAGTDYKYRAKVSRESLAEAAKKIVLDLNYSNFKNSVAAIQGQERAHIYHEVWDALYKLQEEEEYDPLPAQINHSGNSLAYGGVLFDNAGRVLLRKAKNEYDGYVWTFAKGRASKGKTPEETALREVSEETGYNARILKKIEGSFEGGTTVTEYFLMQPVGKPQPFDSETEEVRWVSPEEAVSLIKMTSNYMGRNRDLAVLEAAHKLWTVMKK